MKASLLVATRSSITRSMRTSSARPARSVSRRIRSPSSDWKALSTPGCRGATGTDANPDEALQLRRGDAGRPRVLHVRERYREARPPGRPGPAQVRAGKGWRDFDARVEYRYVAGEYKYLAKAAGA